MLGITDLTTYVLGTIAIVLLPGPNSLFVLSTAARRGVPDGYRAAYGVFLGDTVLMVLSAAGVASLLEAYPPLFMVIKYAGAAYLCYIGVGMLLGVWRRWRGGTAKAARPGTTAKAARPGTTATEPSTAIRGADAARNTLALPAGSAAGPGSAGEAGSPAPDAPGPFRRSLVISLLNPKAILFFVSFFIQFVDPGYSYPVVSFLVLGAIAQVTSALYLSVLIFTGTYLAAQFRSRRRLAAGVTTGLGALFVGFGIKLATAGL